MESGMDGDVEVDVGRTVALVHGHDDHPGRIGTVVETRPRFDEGTDVVVELSGGIRVSALASADLETDWTRVVHGVVEGMASALARAEPLVGLLTVRDVLSEGDPALSASGLNPWCVNEGLATGDERLSSHWLAHAREGAGVMLAHLADGRAGDDLIEGLVEMADAAERAARLVGMLRIGTVFDAGDALVEAAGLDVWCMRDGRATRGDRVGSTGAWRLDHAATRAREVAADLRALPEAGHPAGPGL